MLDDVRVKTSMFVGDEEFNVGDIVELGYGLYRLKYSGRIEKFCVNEDESPKVVIDASKKYHTNVITIKIDNIIQIKKIKE